MAYFLTDNRFFFNLTASGYDFMTAQSLWRAQIEAALVHLSGPDEVHRILDLGCGPGVSAFVLAERFPGATVVGLDISDEMIRRARRHHRRRFPDLDNVTFQRGDVYQMPFTGDHFDLVMGHSFLYLLPHRLQALKAIEQTLRPGGQLLLLEPALEGSLVGACRQISLQEAIASPLSAARFATSMLLWRLVSNRRGQMREAELLSLFEEAGLTDALVHSTLGGLGYHARATKGSGSL